MNISSLLTKILPSATFLKVHSVASSTPSEYEQKFIDTCLAPVEEALQLLQSSDQGLTSEQAETYLHEYGPNDLGKKSHQGFLKEILIRCKKPSCDSAVSHLHCLPHPHE